MNKKTGFFLGLIILVVIAAYGLAINLPTFISKTPVLETGKALAEPMELVAFNLVDHTGKPFQYNDLKEEWSLIFFGYSKCPDVCPTTVFKLTEIYRILNEDKAIEQQPQVIFISIDPGRDKPEILKEYLASFNPEFIGVTGTLDEIKKLMKDRTYLDTIMKTGKEKAIVVAEPVLNQVYDIVGFSKL